MRYDQPDSSVTRVHVVDNSSINSELLANAIGKDRRISVVGVSSRVLAATNEIPNSKPDVLLISSTLEENSRLGFDTLRKLRAAIPDLKAVLLLDSPRPELIIQAFQAGARGVFSRNEPVKTLCKCLSVVHQGQIWANSEELGVVLEALMAGNSLCHRDTEALRDLSEREQDVVGCLAQGMTNRQIADHLEISQHTVKNYMFRIFEKVGVSSRVELLFFVLSQTNKGSFLRVQGNGDATNFKKKAVMQTLKVTDIRSMTPRSLGKRPTEVQATSAQRRAADLKIALQDVIGELSNLG